MGWFGGKIQRMTFRPTKIIVRSTSWDLHTHMHGSMAHNRQVSMHGWMEEQNVVHQYSAMLLSLIKEGASDIYYNVDEPGKYYAHPGWWSPWLEHRPIDKKVSSSNPGQRYAPGLQVPPPPPSGCVSLPPSLFLSRNQWKSYLQVRIHHKGTSQTEKTNVAWFHFYEISLIGQFIDTKSTLEVIRAWDEVGPESGVSGGGEGYCF